MCWSLGVVLDGIDEGRNRSGRYSVDGQQQGYLYQISIRLYSQFLSRVDSIQNCICSVPRHSRFQHSTFVFVEYSSTRFRDCCKLSSDITVELTMLSQEGLWRSKSIGAFLMFTDRQKCSSSMPRQGWMPKLLRDKLRCQCSFYSI